MKKRKIKLDDKFISVVKEVWNDPKKVDKN